MLNSQLFSPLAGLISIAKKLGVPVERLQPVTTSGHLDTHAGAENRIQQFLQSGFMNSGAGEVRVSTPMRVLNESLTRMAPEQAEKYQRYILLRDSMDVFNLKKHQLQFAV